MTADKEVTPMSIGGFQRRFFCPIRTDDLVERAKPFINQWVTVDGWHENVRQGEGFYPNDERVGFVVEFAGDIPESELLWDAPKARGEHHV